MGRAWVQFCVRFAQRLEVVSMVGFSYLSLKEWIASMPCCFSGYLLQSSLPPEEEDTLGLPHLALESMSYLIWLKQK